MLWPCTAHHHEASLDRPPFPMPRLRPVDGQLADGYQCYTSPKNAASTSTSSTVRVVVWTPSS